MKHAKLNNNWNTSADNPGLQISSLEDGIDVSFNLNATEFEYIVDGERGVLEFRDVYAYGLGAVPDETQFQKVLKVKKDQTSEGLYELIGSNLSAVIADNKVLLDDTLDKKELRHFIFFLKDQTLECFAGYFIFRVDNNLEEILDEKYPKGYLNHYLSMFASQFDKPSTDSFKIYTNLYLQMESKKEFEALKVELKNIKKDKDLHLYLKYANAVGILDFGTKQLNDMVKVIEGYKV